MSAAVATVMRFLAGVEGEPDENLLATLHEEIEVHDFDLPDAGVYKGHEGVGRWLADWDAPWDEWRTHVHDLLDLGDQVVTLNHLTARTGSGLTVDREDSQLYTIRDGRIAKLEYFGEAETASQRAHDPARAAVRERVHDKLRAKYRAVLHGDVEGVLSLLRPDYEFTPEADAPMMNTAYRGHEEARRYFEELFEAWEMLRFDVERLIDVGDSVVSLVVVEGRGRGSGIELSARQAEISQTEGEDLVSSRFFQSHDEALSTAGVSG